MRNLKYRILGANRGGREHTAALLASPAGTMLESVHIVDPTPGRAQSLAGPFEERGVETTYAEDSAQSRSEVDVLEISIDDATDTADILSNSRSIPLTECGIVVAANIHGDLGGNVIAIGTTLTPAEKEIRSQAEAVFDRIAALSPKRQTSKNITERILNSSQVGLARQGMHDHFVEKSTNLGLEQAEDQSDLFVIDSRGSEHLIHAVEAHNQPPRRKLKDIAIHEVLPSAPASDPRSGVVFYDNKDHPWLFFVFGQYTRNRWSVLRTIELPVRLPAPRIVELETSEISERKSRISSAREVISETFVTD